MPIFVKIHVVILVENVPVETLVVLQFFYRLFVHRGRVFSDNILSVLCHFLVPLVVPNVLIYMVVIVFQVKFLWRFILGYFFLSPRVYLTF